jgi:hypothetical protein
MENPWGPMKNSSQKYFITSEGGCLWGPLISTSLNSLDSAKRIATILIEDGSYDFLRIISLFGEEAYVFGKEGIIGTHPETHIDDCDDELPTLSINSESPVSQEISFDESSVNSDEIVKIDMLSSLTGFNIQKIYEHSAENLLSILYEYLQCCDSIESLKERCQEEETRRNLLQKEMTDKITVSPKIFINATDMIMSTDFETRLRDNKRLWSCLSQHYNQVSSGKFQKVVAKRKNRKL